MMRAVVYACSVGQNSTERRPNDSSLKCSLDRNHNTQQRILRLRSRSCTCDDQECGLQSEETAQRMDKGMLPPQALLTMRSISAHIFGSVCWSTFS